MRLARDKQKPPSEILDTYSVSDLEYEKEFARRYPFDDCWYWFTWIMLALFPKSKFDDWMIGERGEKKLTQNSGQSFLNGLLAMKERQQHKEE